uniref:Uncharacterized protein n=1 Tax=Siphoviridae sp. ctOqH1 TaxID=2826316 RepID=A0A8S5NBL5_9CAUD|nr:MAG TPA: hypothetical protein [Siphoviridae sp. ctOqH1]
MIIFLINYFNGFYFRLFFESDFVVAREIKNTIAIIVYKKYIIPPCLNEWVTV